MSNHQSGKPRGIIIVWFIVVIIIITTTNIMTIYIVQ